MGSLLAVWNVMFTSKYAYNLFRRNKGNYAFVVLETVKNDWFVFICRIYGFSAHAVRLCKSANIMFVAKLSLI